MKSNLLLMTMVFAGLAGLTSAQTYEQRGPGYGYGLRERPGATVNMVTAGQLTQWMQDRNGSSVATADQWCYAMGQVVAGGYICPAPENFGFTGSERNATVDAQTFLNNLRAYETGVSAGPVGPGGGQPLQTSPGVAACRRAVQDRLRADGYSDVRIPSINAEDGPRGADRVYGLAEARQRYGRAEQFDFSCAVNLERGQVRSLDVNPR
jgi:hypothetical protein